MNLPFIYHRDFGILKQGFHRENSLTFSRVQQNIATAAKKLQVV